MMKIRKDITWTQTLRFVFGTRQTPIKGLGGGIKSNLQSQISALPQAQSIIENVGGSESSSVNLLKQTSDTKHVFAQTIFSLREKLGKTDSIFIFHTFILS